MAYNHLSLFTFACVVNMLLCAVGYATAVRDAPTTAETEGKKQPEFLHHDGTFLLPGFGRYVHPKKSLHCINKFKFNPITGTCGGSGLSDPGLGHTGSSGRSGRTYVPGGDDTNVPNPGVEIPNPGNGGHIGAPSPH